MVNWKKLVKEIPHKVHIGFKQYFEVVWVDDFPDGNTYGETRYDKKQIALKKGLSNKITVLTYLHEITHSVSFIYEVGLTETQVLKIESSLTTILKDGNVFTKKKRKK